MPTATRSFRLIFAVLLFSLGLDAAAQKTPDHETISTAQGLSQGMIYALLQDKEGFIWVGTKEGLNRYDGYTFKVFTNDPYDRQSISGNNIRTLFEDSRGRIWAGALEAGLNVYDKKSGKFRRIMHESGNPASLSSNRISASTIELPDGRIMVAPGNNSRNIISLPDDYLEEIQVKSPPAGANKGTEFTVILPMEKSPVTEEQPIYPFIPEPLVPASGMEPVIVPLMAEEVENTDRSCRARWRDCSRARMPTSRSHFTGRSC